MPLYVNDRQRASDCEIKTSMISRTKAGAIEAVFLLFDKLMMFLVLVKESIRKQKIKEREKKKMIKKIKTK